LIKFLGLVGYCHLWIDSYALKTKSLYVKLTQEGLDPLIWTPKEIEQVDYLKQALITALVLALLSLEQPFHLFVNVNKGVALGVLTQKHGGQHQPVAFLSKFLIPITQGWPEYIQAIGATALLTKESRKNHLWGKPNC
jgi:hypothetical protein